MFITFFHNIEYIILVFSVPSASKHHLMMNIKLYSNANNRVLDVSFFYVKLCRTGIIKLSMNHLTHLRSKAGVNKIENVIEKFTWIILTITYIINYFSCV